MKFNQRQVHHCDKILFQLASHIIQSSLHIGLVPKDFTKKDYGTVMKLADYFLKNSFEYKLNESEQCMHLAIYNKYDSNTIKILSEIINDLNTFTMYISRTCAINYGFSNSEYALLSKKDNTAKDDQETSNNNKNTKNTLVVQISLIDKLENLPNKELIVIPDIVALNLNLQYGDAFYICQLQNMITDTILDKKLYRIPMAREIYVATIHNKYCNYITQEYAIKLLYQMKTRIVRDYMILKIDLLEDLESLKKYIKSPIKLAKLLHLISNLELKSCEIYLKIIRINPPPRHYDEFYLNYANSCLRDWSIIEPNETKFIYMPYNVNNYLPIHNLYFHRDKYANEQFYALSNTQYYNTQYGLLNKIIKYQIRSNIKLQFLLLRTTSTSGCGKGLILHNIKEKYGFNLVTKNLRSFYTLSKIEKFIQKSMIKSPIIIVIKNLEFISRIIDNRPQISKTPNENYIQYLKDCIITQAQQLNNDYTITLICTTTLNKEKESSAYDDLFDMVINFENPSPQEWLEIIPILIPKYILEKQSKEKLEELSQALKGLSWKALRKIIMKTPSNDLPNLSSLMKKIENTKKESTEMTALSIPNVTWEDVGGLIEAKNEIIDTVMLPQMFPELFTNKISPRTGLLFYGPPGTGKTLLAKAIATECKMNFMTVKGPELLNMYVGESEKNVREIFDKARTNLPCIIFFDELDALVPNRGKSSDSNSVMDRIVAQFLTEIDGVGKKTGLFVIGATNRPDLLDASLLRPGRFDKMIYLGISEDKESRMKILKAQTRKFKLAENIDLSAIEEKIPKNFTGADFYALTSRSLLKATRRKINEFESRYQKDKDANKGMLIFDDWIKRYISEEDKQILVEENDFYESLKEIKPSVSEQELEKYKHLKMKFKQ